MERKDDFIQEFGEKTQDSEKLSEVFESLIGIKDSLQPNASFKKSLWKRLTWIIEIKNINSHIEKRQFHLFAWVFASFFFVGVFLYFLSESLFQNPISWKTLELQTEKIAEQGTIEVENITTEVPAPIYKEEDFDNSKFIKPQKKIVQKEKKETQELREDTQPIDTLNWEESTEEDVSDNLNIETQAFQETDSFEELSIVENDDVSEVQTEAFWWEGSSDSTQQENSLKENISFENYCSEAWGIFKVSEISTTCTKWSQTCSLSEYETTKICFLEDNVEADSQIFLEELIEEFWQ